jgi:hypothetical protein
MNRSASEHPACRYVAIGASGGDGLHDIRELLAALPHPVAAVVMVVLHRPVDAISRLREVLATATPASVVVAREGEALEQGRVYIGEPAHHLTLLAGGGAGLVPGVANEYRNRTVDVLFRSLAAHAGASAVGVVLSGSLDDGSRGLAAIHAARGVTMVLTPPDRRGAPGMSRERDRLRRPGRRDRLGDRHRPRDHAPARRATRRRGDPRPPRPLGASQVISAGTWPAATRRTKA